jgi:hypothetical protein
MAIAAEPSLPSGPPLAGDRAAVGGAAASETSITASAVVATTAITIAIADDDDHPRDGHNANDRIQTMTMDNRMDDTVEKEHGVPSSTGIEMFKLMRRNGDDVRGYEGDVAAARTVISPTAKSLLCAYFVSINWPLNKVLPKGGELLSSDLGVIMRDHGLVKTQVLHQLLNYKKECLDFSSRQSFLVHHPF